VAALEGKATVQLFSALRRVGVEEAQDQLVRFLEAAPDSV